MKVYHLSKMFLGKEAILHPKIPSSSLISKEGNIPRVCFSTQIKYCVRSICGTRKLAMGDMIEFREEGNKKLIINPSIYVPISNRTDLYLPPDASDFKINREHWALESIEVAYIGKLCLLNFSQGKIVITELSSTLDRDTINNDHEQRIKLSRSNKILQATR